MKYSQEHSFVKSLTGNLLHKVSREFGSVVATKEKSGHADIVTKQDLLLDKLIIRKIKKNFPKDVIITEESSAKLLPRAKQGERSWIIDPLCGSLNYARALPIFNTNIILAEEGRVVAAWVVDYPLKRLLWSTGNGTYVNNKKLTRLRHHSGYPCFQRHRQLIQSQHCGRRPRSRRSVPRCVLRERPQGRARHSGRTLQP